MAGLKDKIQNESMLRIIVETQRSAFTSAVQLTAGHLEQAYKKYRVRRVIGVVLLMSFPVWSWVWGFYPVFPSWLLFLVSSLSIGFGLTYMLRGMHVVNQFNQLVDTALYAQILELLGVSCRLVPQTTVLPTKVIANPRTFSERVMNFIAISKTKVEENEEILGALRQAELITESYNTTQIDTVMECTYETRSFTVAELEVKQITGSGKNRSVREIFYGYFVQVPLGRRLEGKTFVTAQDDKTGFAQRSMFGGGVPETQLEWNEFEDLLHVATTDGTEARYILTPDYMQDLYTWWKGQEGAIRVSFIGARMCILFPDKRMKLHDTVAAITEDEVVEYAFSIARPMYHIVNLIEDVKL